MVTVISIEKVLKTAAQNFGIFNVNNLGSKFFSTCYLNSRFLGCHATRDIPKRAAKETN